MLNRFIAVVTILFSVSMISASYDKAPNFTLKNLEGKSFELYKALEEGPVLLEFWATWCQPCKKSLPEYQRIAEEYADKGLSVITINTDGPRNLSKVRPFLKAHRITLPVLLDLNAKVSSRFQVSGMPTAILIDKNKEILYFHMGYKTGDHKKIIKILEEIF